jgi:serine phosphatase RsbU (regulator of sigma subunit)
MGEADVVLAIDDDALVREVFAGMLESVGLKVIQAPNGVVGLQKFRELKPGAVLLDLRMPGLDGLDVLSAMVEASPETPVIVVSGAGTTEDVVEALRRGAWDFVLKPVQDPELLIRGVQRGLEKSRLLRLNREYSESLKDINLRLTRALETLRAGEQAARQLQFKLLPEDGLRVGPYTSFRRLFPSQFLSGDFVDYFAVGERYLGFYVADVAGHGAASAFMTAILTTLVHEYRDALGTQGDETILHPQQFLTRLDADLAKHRLEKHITMFFGVLDVVNGRLVYSNAGAFPYPFLCNGDDVVELECVGRPLNLPGRGKLTQQEAILQPGGRLLIASDGVLELERGKSCGAKRKDLADLTRRSRDIQSVLSALNLEESRPVSDDIALLLLCREEQSNHA